MTIHIDTLTADIDRHDQFRLQTMVRGVLANRPTFRSIAARVGDERVAIFTRCEGDDRRSERLIVQGDRNRLTLSAADRSALERILHETA